MASRQTAGVPSKLGGGESANSRGTEQTGGVVSRQTAGVPTKLGGGESANSRGTDQTGEVVSRQTGGVPNKLGEWCVGRPQGSRINWGESSSAERMGHE